MGKNIVHPPDYSKNIKLNDMKPKTIIAIIFIVLIIIFSVQNAEITNVEFLFWRLTISKVMVIMGSFLVGIIVGLLFSMRRKKPVH